MFRWFTLCGALIAASGFANAQTASRRAALIGGGSPNGGKCTVEVMVDSSAEVEVRGDTATLRNTGGQTPQWRRFECTSAMPANPVEFRFAGVDGRGRQTLIRDPRNSAGTAVVRIEDSDSGAEGYTFDLFWGNYSAPISQDRNGRRPDEFQQGSAGRPVDRQDRGFDRQGDFRGEPRLNAERTIQSCRDSIRETAYNRFRTPNVNISRISVDDNPGRQDWITGELAIPRRFGRQDLYRFSCSVDLRSGVVRSAHIDQFERSFYPQGR
jgi:hypothetical protein